MTIPLYMVVAQWVLLIALGLLVTVMYRQLGWHLNVTKKDPVLGPEVGSRAGEIEYVDSSNSAIMHRYAPSDGRPALLAFVDPMCPACEQLVETLNGADLAGELTSIRVLLLITDPPSYLQISEPFRTTRFEIGQLVSDTAIEAYRASATPLLVAIGADQTVRAAGSVMSADDVGFFARACLMTTPTNLLPVVTAHNDEGQHPAHAASTVASTMEGKSL